LLVMAWVTASVLAGCTPAKRPADDLRPIKGTPSEVLVEAQKRLVRFSFRVKGTLGSEAANSQLRPSSFDGVFAPNLKEYSLTAKLGGVTEYHLRLGGVSYWRATTADPVATFPKDTWSRTKWAENDADVLTGMRLVAASGAYLCAITAVTADGGGYSGTVDLERAAGAPCNQWSKPAKRFVEELTQKGVRVDALPFRAQLDDKGRLAALAVDLPGQFANQSPRFSFSDYGLDVQLDRPKKLMDG
jgi:hypothetical protein